MYFGVWGGSAFKMPFQETAEKFKNTVDPPQSSKKENKKIPKTIIESREAASITAFIPLSRSQPPAVKETSSGKFLEL